MNQDQIMSLIRQGLSLIGGYLIIKGIIGSADWTTLVGSLMGTVSIIWSLFTHNTPGK